MSLMEILKRVQRDYLVASWATVHEKYQRLTINHHSMKTQQLTTQETLCSRIYDTRHAGGVVFTNLPA